MLNKGDSNKFNEVEQILRSRATKTSKILVVGENIRETQNPLYYLMTGKFSKSFFNTIGVDTYSKEIYFENKKVILSVWNLCINKRFLPIYNLSLLGSKILLLLYDVGDEASFSKIIEWYELNKKSLEKSTIVILIGQRKENEKNTKTITSKINELLKHEEIWGHHIVSRNSKEDYENVLNDLVILSIKGFYVFSDLIDKTKKEKFITEALLNDTSLIEEIDPPLNTPSEILAYGDKPRKIRFKGIPEFFEVNSYEIILALHDMKLQELRDKLIWNRIWKDYVRIMLDKVNAVYEIDEEKKLVKIVGKYNTYYVSAISGRAKTEKGSNLLCIVPIPEASNIAVISDPILKELYNISEITLTGNDAMFISVLYSLANDELIKDEMLLEQIKYNRYLDS